MPTPLFRFEDIHLEKTGRTILEGVTASLFPGDTVILTGPSGSGKTSLLRLMNRLESPASGKIFFEEAALESFSPSLLRRRVALVPQTPIFFPGTVLENLQQVDLMHRRKLRPPEAYEARLSWVGLPIKLSQEAQSLSLGEKQRLSIARTLLNQPDILLLDEPTSALDQAAAHHLTASLKDLQSQWGMSLLMVTHQAAYGEKIGTRFWRLESGHLTVSSGEEGLS